MAVERRNMGWRLAQTVLYNILIYGGACVLPFVCCNAQQADSRESDIMTGNRPGHCPRILQRTITGQIRVLHEFYTYPGANYHPILSDYNLVKTLVLLFRDADEATTNALIDELDLGVEAIRITRQLSEFVGRIDEFISRKPSGAFSQFTADKLKKTPGTL